MPLLDWLNPLVAIAKELASIRELYELDLASRNPPIIRVTERPHNKDTEIFYGEDDEAEEKSAIRKFFDLGEFDPDEED